ncbi:DUF192 domain-containing protein [Ancylothrix sp. C2]|uniref:DUF192 domain-containing protein n=1 Tax=Ancylothrix sp. D3o TaxID=2953691 RepID=UPI0021BB54F3|nr:DUF192 domain-containing protein [Ancylothrix sp. D3o]MCT7948372.1 DUF192 domain-containing protein [Ancylothrix sp. D3o]
MRKNNLFAIAISILLMGCSQPATSTIPETATPTPTAQAQTPQPQDLPISAKATIAGEIFELEVTETPEQQAMGLMFRRSLPDNRGMLFSFNPPRPVMFWMKNTLIPLDMIFLRDGEVKYIAENVPPCTTMSCPTYGPPDQISIDQVIEVRAGRTAELGLKTGNRITIEFLDQKKPR